jgi:predicted MPP superfamily phosphohydrolase
MRFLITLISIFFITGYTGNPEIIPSEKIVGGVVSDIVAESGKLPIQIQPVTFVLLTDMHVNPGSASDTSLNQIVDEINRLNVDFIVVTGDLTNTGSDAELLAVKKALDKLTKPCYVLPGNHETNWAESAGLTINKLWGNDRFLFSRNGYLFVGLNTGPYIG